MAKRHPVLKIDHPTSILVLKTDRPMTTSILIPRTCKFGTTVKRCPSVKSAHPAGITPLYETRKLDYPCSMGSPRRVECGPQGMRNAVHNACGTDAFGMQSTMLHGTRFPSMIHPLHDPCRRMTHAAHEQPPTLSTTLLRRHEPQTWSTTLLRQHKHQTTFMTLDLPSPHRATITLDTIKF